MTEIEISKISNDEKLRIKIIENGIHKNMFKGKTIVPYDKGGSSDIEAGRLRNYFAESDFFIDWSESNVKRMKTLTIAQRKSKSWRQKAGVKKSYETKIASRLQNTEYYFKNGITFSLIGMYSPTFRINSNSIFDVGGSSLFIKDKLKVFLIKKTTDENHWEALIKGLSKLSPGTEVEFGSGELKAILTRRQEDKAILKLIYKGQLDSILSRLGRMPLPPYIRRKKIEKMPRRRGSAEYPFAVRSVFAFGHKCFYYVKLRLKPIEAHDC